MARNDQAAGPIKGQIVLYNNGGVIGPAVINGVNSTGTVNLCQFPAPGSATNVDRATVGYSPGAQTAGTWGYPEFF